MLIEVLNYYSSAYNLLTFVYNILKRKKQMKKILIDLRYLRNLNYGFGQFCLAFGTYLKENPESHKDLDITLHVPKSFVGKFGDKVRYISPNKIRKPFPFLFPRFDIWHSTTQSQRYFYTPESCSRIITIHDLNMMSHYSGNKLRKRLNKLQKNIDISDHFTVISHFTEGEIKKHLVFDNKPITVNYVGVRNLTQDKQTKPTFVKSDAKFFFTIGQVVEKKNFHVLVDMMALMPEYTLYICGQDHFPYAEKIRKDIQEKKLNNVIVTGSISAEEKVWMYQNCHAFVFPSTLEGFGIPVIEAMSFGKPVFSSRLTSLDEIGGDFAYFWNNFEAEHMCETIRKNIDQFYANSQLIANQINYADSFSMSRSFENFLNLYRSMPAKKKAISKASKI